MTSSMPTPTQSRLVSLQGAAERLGLSLRAVYRLIASGTLPPPVKVGGASRLFESDLDAYLDRLQRARLSPSRTESTWATPTNR